MDEKIKRKIWKIFLCSIIIAFAIEVFVCNFRTWESLMWKSTNLIEQNRLVSESSVKIKNDDLYVCAFRNDGWCDIDTDSLENIPGGGLNIYVHAYYLDENKNPVLEPVSVSIKARDEGNDLLYLCGTRVIVPTGRRANYFRLNLSGKAKQIELTFQQPKEQIKYVCLESVILNKKVPISIYWFRVLITSVFIFIIAIAHPSSVFWKLSFESMKKCKIHIVIPIIMIVICAAMVYINPKNKSISDHDEYVLLTESILHGKVYLEEKPSQTLMEMNNPYDNFLRDKIMKEANEKWNLDWAYFHGKYYVYFGILPVLFFFLPFYLITGVHISYGTIAIILSAFYISGISYLLDQIYKRYFTHTSILSFYLWELMFIVGTGQAYALRSPSLYSTPIFLAGTLAIWGVGIWISVLPITANYNNNKGNPPNLNLIKIAAGSLLISLTALTRPQFLIVGLMACVIFRENIFEKPYLKNKEKWKICLALAIPALTIAFATMYYNFVRFGSVFDFGANYNLTSNDMTHRGIHIDRLFSGIFYYLFEPTKIGCVFPFIIDSGKMSVRLTDYLGRSIVEGPYGGLLFNRPILFLTFWLIKAQTYMKQVSKKIWYMAIFCAVSAAIILFADIQMAGIVSRYNMDYGWLLCISSMLFFNSLEVVSDDATLKKIIRGVLLFSVCWSIIYEFLLLCTNLDRVNSIVYYELRNLLQFWL